MPFLVILSILAGCPSQLFKSTVSCRKKCKITVIICKWFEYLPGIPQNKTIMRIHRSIEMWCLKSINKYQKFSYTPGTST